MKKYLTLCSIKNLNIKVIYNDSETIFEGNSNDLPDNLKEVYYSKATGPVPMCFYIYDE